MWDRQNIYWDIYSDRLENADLIKGKAGGNSPINFKMERIWRSLTKGLILTLHEKRALAAKCGYANWPKYMLCFQAAHVCALTEDKTGEAVLMCFCVLCSCCTFNFRTRGEGWPSINVLAWLLYESTNQFSSSSDASVPILVVLYLSVKTSWHGLTGYYVIASRTIKYSGHSLRILCLKLSCLRWQCVANKIGESKKQELFQAIPSQIERRWQYQNIWFQIIPRSHSNKNGKAQERRQAHAPVEQNHRPRNNSR